MVKNSPEPGHLGEVETKVMLVVGRGLNLKLNQTVKSRLLIEAANSNLNC